MSYTARVLDDAIKAGIAPEEFEEFRRSFPRKKSQQQPKRASFSVQNPSLFARAFKSADTTHFQSAETTQALSFWSTTELA